MKGTSGYFLYMNPLYDQNDATGQGILKGKIQRWCEEQGLQKVDMVWVPSPEDQTTCGIFNINPKAINTVLVYKKRKVTAKWVDMNYNDQAINAMLKMIDLPS